MDYIYSRNLDLRLSRLGIGLSGLGISYKNKDLLNKRQKVIENSLELGVNYFDTAEIYGGGFSETFFGDLMKSLRSSVILMTKFYPRDHSILSIEKQLKKSLGRLQTDYLDVWQIHWPNPELELLKLFENLKKLQSKGYFKAIGTCNFSKNMIQQVQKYFPDTIVTHQTAFQIHSFQKFKEFNSYLQSIGIVNLFYNAFSTSLSTVPKLNYLLEKFGLKKNQFPIKLLSSFKDTSTIIKTSKIDNLLENYKSCHEKLDQKALSCICERFPNKGLNFLKPKSILVPQNSSFDIYHDLKSALENNDDLIPSPQSLASLIKSKDFDDPVKVKLIQNGYNKAYVLDSYDLRGEVKKFWAYQIAFGENCSIPVEIT